MNQTPSVVAMSFGPFPDPVRYCETVYRTGFGSIGCVPNAGGIYHSREWATGHDGSQICRCYDMKWIRKADVSDVVIVPPDAWWMKTD
jgi:hypothetical protein